MSLKSEIIGYIKRNEMKEINESDSVVPVLKEEQEVVTPAPAEYKYLGSKRFVPGLRLYGFNMKTQEFSEVKIERAIAYDIKSKTMKIKCSVSWDPNTIYHQAHCERTAKKKFNKLFKQMGLNILL